AFGIEKWYTRIHLNGPLCRTVSQVGSIGVNSSLLMTDRHLLTSCGSLYVCWALGLGSLSGRPTQSATRPVLPVRERSSSERPAGRWLVSQRGGYGRPRTLPSHVRA